MPSNPIMFEGLTADEIMELPQSELDGLVFCNQPLVVKIGSSEILGQFSLQTGRMIIELGHIDGGGEGVLPGIGALAQRIAKQRSINEIEWRVHAVHCEKPNLKLRRMLDRRGFQVRSIEGGSSIYFQVQSL
jgi:hypothetical protein